MWRWPRGISPNFAICWLSDPRSPLIMYVNSCISAGRSSNSDFFLATEINETTMKTYKYTIYLQIENVILTESEFLQFRISTSNILADNPSAVHKLRVRMQLTLLGTIRRRRRQSASPERPNCGLEFGSPIPGSHDRGHQGRHRQRFRIELRLAVGLGAPSRQTFPVRPGVGAA